MLKLLVFLVLLVFSITGCVVTETVGRQAKAVTDKICRLPIVERDALRATVDAATFPNKIRIECSSTADER